MEKEVKDTLSKTIITKPLSKKDKLKRKTDEQREKDKTTVRGVFRNHETPGAPLSFSYLAYKGDSLETYTLKDETIYSLPYGVVKHLNTNCWYPVHSHTMNAEGLPAIGVGKKVRRFSFSALDFTDESEFNTSDIVTARQL